MIIIITTIIMIRDIGTIIVMITIILNTITNYSNFHGYLSLQTTCSLERRQTCQTLPPSLHQLGEAKAFKNTKPDNVGKRENNAICW